MLISKGLTVALVTVLFVAVGWSRHAHAYVDLGTGSYLLQLLVASMFGLIFSMKSLWAKVRAVFLDADRREN